MKPADDAGLPRCLPQVDFPPYTYVPGETPHPLSHPRGHRFGVAAERCNASPEPWYRCDEYLHGIDLFNHGYYWEAHEAWEAVWHAAGRSGSFADFLKGLIKLAAAGVKTRVGSTSGRQRHCRRAAELFRHAARGRGDAGASKKLMGLSLETLARWAVEAEQEFSSSAIPTPASEAHPPRVFSFVLWPGPLPVDR